MIYLNSFAFVVAKLYRYGYFWCDEATAVDLVEESDLSKLRPTDPVVQAAVRKYQSVFKEDLDRECERRYQRAVDVDGLIGEATGSVLSKPRCGHPDFANPRQAVMQATHPESCRFDLTYSFNYDEIPGTGVNPQEIHDQAIDNWQSLFEFRCVRGSRSKGGHRPIILARLPRGVLADQYLANNTCGGTFRGRFDSRRQLSVAEAIAIDAHEFGHFLGLGHETRDKQALMYPSIHQAGIRRGGTPNVTDQNNLEDLGYERRSTPEPPDPPAPPDDNVNRLRQELIESLGFALDKLSRAA